MLDSFIQSFSRFWILSCYWFHLLSCHLVGISKTTWIFHCFCISHTCCSEECCQLSFCAANHAHSPSEAFKGWFGCLRSFLYHICIDSPFFRRYSIFSHISLVSWTDLAQWHDVATRVRRSHGRKSRRFSLRESSWGNQRWAAGFQEEGAGTRFLHSQGWAPKTTSIKSWISECMPSWVAYSVVCLWFCAAQFLHELRFSSSGNQSLLLQAVHGTSN